MMYNLGDLLIYSPSDRHVGQVWQSRIGKIAVITREPNPDSAYRLRFAGEENDIWFSEQGLTNRWKKVELE